MTASLRSSSLKIVRPEQMHLTLVFLGETAGFLCLGTGGALAVVGGVPPFSSGGEGSASCTQYRPGNGFGDKNHCHTGPPGQTGEHPGNGNGHGH